MTEEKRHIWETSVKERLKILLTFSTFISFGMAIAYFFFQKSFLSIFCGFFLGSIFACSYLRDDYKGMYVAGFIIGTLGSIGGLSMISSDPFILGFAPIGGFIAALIILGRDSMGDI